MALFTLGLTLCLSRVADSVSAARHQPGTVQLSADSQISVVAKMPPVDENPFGQHFGLGQSPTLGHVYGLGRSPK